MFGRGKTTVKKATNESSQKHKVNKEQSKKGKSMKAFNGNGSEGTTTLISKGTEIIGDIRFNGNLEIEGRVNGNITASTAGGAMVRVLENGEVEGDIDVPVVVINGSIQGDVRSGTHIELANKAKVDGDVHYNLIEMVKGAQINGSLLYSGTEQASTANNNTAKKTMSGKGTEAKPDLPAGVRANH